MEWDMAQWVWTSSVNRANGRGPDAEAEMNVQPEGERANEPRHGE